MKRLDEETLNLLYSALFLAVAIGGIILLLMTAADSEALQKRY